MTKWVFSDPHFGHANIIRFKKPDGSVIRPRLDGTSFESIEEHDELLVERYNDCVSEGDDVYFLGDIGKPLSIIRRLKGRKKLILGNHDDIHDARDLASTFKSVRSWKVWNDPTFSRPVVFCHYPLHRYIDEPVPRRICVHGHIHEKAILQEDGTPDPWYINVCVEHTQLAPLSFEALDHVIRGRFP